MHSVRAVIKLTYTHVTSTLTITATAVSTAAILGLLVVVSVTTNSTNSYDAVITVSECTPLRQLFSVVKTAAVTRDRGCWSMRVSAANTAIAEQLSYHWSHFDTSQILIATDCSSICMYRNDSCIVLTAVSGRL
jgi:hypothetical protein